MRKVCKKCRIFVQGDECPLCHGKDFTESWKGKLIILNANESEIAKKLDIKAKGEYAIKIR